jgi:asparagine synthase (glutamine-hydrolysing)
VGQRQHDDLVRGQTQTLMCGIAGIVDFDGRPIDEGLVPSMCGAIRHRGPDDEGVLALPALPQGAAPRAVLGSRRLSIIDLAGGHQPIGNEDGSIWTVQNGEIYNFAALRERLERAGHRFKTRSDTEVIVHLYEEMGDAFVRELDGMFALALWDDRRKRLVLARDRFGKKPLQYFERQGRLWFASEFQALLADRSIPRELNPEALDEYLSFMAIPAPLTIYKDVWKLPPAHFLVRDTDGTTVARYWSLAYTPKRRIDEAEAVSEVKRLLREAVRKRLISDVPLGAFLSGGVDSSGVVAMMASLASGAVKTFSIGFDDARYNELPHARRVAQQYACEHHEFEVRPSALEVLPTLVRHYGEPYADSSAIPSFYLARLTRQHVTVALNGDGGDEMFAGYGWHLAGQLAQQWQRLPTPVRRVAESAARAVTPASADRRSTATRAMRFLAGASRARPAQYRAWLSVFTEDLKRALYATPPPAHHDRLACVFAANEGLDGVDAMLAADVAWYLPTDLLVKMDIATMANSLEARSPFLDRDLAEFVAALPSAMKLKGRESKYLLKRVLEGLVPTDNMYRRKQGFAVPIAQWFRADLRDYLADHVLSSRFTSRGLFNPREVRRLFDDHQQQRADYAHHLWVLLMLELWFREYIDPAIHARQAV